jgi:hypothetical protein
LGVHGCHSFQKLLAVAIVTKCVATTWEIATSAMASLPYPLRKLARISAPGSGRHKPDPPFCQGLLLVYAAGQAQIAGGNLEHFGHAQQRQMGAFVDAQSGRYAIKPDGLDN